MRREAALRVAVGLLGCRDRPGSSAKLCGAEGSPPVLASVTIIAVLVLTGCASDGGSREEAASTLVSVSSSAPSESTTTAVAGVTTTTLASPGVLEEYVPPTEALSSFDFRLWMVNPEGVPEVDGEVGDAFDTGPDGLVSVGVFVAPDAVSCNSGNPSFVSPSLGVGTAIGSDFWFDDGMSSGEPTPRTEEFAVEWLGLCPGAHEYWATPIFLNDRFTSDFVGEGGEIDGHRTVVYELSSTTPEVRLEDGKVWLTDEGWPIRVEINGSVRGGVFTFLEFDEIDDADLSDSMVPFEIELSITGADSAQVVRAPDGSVSVGPLNDPVVTVGAPTPASDALAAVLDDASDSLCFETDSLSSVVTSDELHSFQISQIRQTSQFGDSSTATMVTPGMAGGGIGTQVVSSAPIDVAVLHAEVLFNHRAPLIALFDWLGWVPPEMERNGELYISVNAPTEQGSEEAVVASWNGQTITDGSGMTKERTWHSYLAFPDESLALDAETADEVRSLLADWRTEIQNAAAGLLDFDPQSATNLEFLYDGRDEIRQQGCALLGTSWANADAALSDDQEDPTPELVEESAAQHLMLSLEYLDLLGGYLEDPEIDWLRADGVDLDTGIIAGDTPGAIITFWTNMLLEALALSDPATYG